MIPASTSYLLEKVKFGVKNEEKLFYQTKDHYFLFLNGETQNFPKYKDFLPMLEFKTFAEFSMHSFSSFLLFINHTKSCN